MLLRVALRTRQSFVRIKKFEEQLNAKKVEYKKQPASCPTYILWLNDQKVILPYPCSIKQASLAEW